MAETTTSPAKTSPVLPKKPQSRGVNITIWVLQVLLSLQFLGAGSAKLAGSEAMVDMFDEIGAGEWFRYLVGTLELAGAVGLLIPLLSGFTALCLSAFMVCATLTSAVILDEQFFTPLAVLVVAVIVARGRRAKTKALFARVGLSSSSA
jgi:putative oxidoreductase